MTSPIRPTDEDARTLARDLLNRARHAALAVLTRDGHPMVSRVAVLWHAGAVLTLVSDLSQHSKALADRPECSVLVGDPGPKGDPLTHSRLTLQCAATSVDKSAHRELWLSAHPKAKLYIDFTDFRILCLTPSEAFLNGGFGKAFHLNRQDLLQK